jgi:hypothetical protein
MEKEGILNALNEVHLFALHHVFLPRINKGLQEFVAQWNSHPVSSARNLSPEQLFISGTFENANSPVIDNSIFMNQCYSGFESIGTGSDHEDLDVPYATEQNNYDIQVPEIEIHLSDDVKAQLKEAVNPLLDDGTFGINTFIFCCQFLQVLIT